MDWIINKKQNNNLRPTKKKKVKNYQKAKLRYCLDCKKVWEISTSGSILFYEHLPTYGLERRICKSCNNLNTKTYKQQRGSNEKS